ncbi:hypothetical protein GQ54DRAFT_23539 [Martensiomyces pterosporus]|nr:hypothetical protein GQ54DRAFT_23539 [Martensiomyces pterosporus]
MAIAAIYSYTVSYGKILCDSEKRFHYYTLLSNYLPWVASILGNTPSIYSDNPGYRLSSNTNYTMNATASANAQGMKLFGGDFVDVIDAYPTATTKTKHSSTPTGAATGSSSFTPTPTPTTPQGASSSSNTSSSGGLSQGQTIGIAVGVSVGVTLLLVAAFLGYRKWKKNQLEQGWDPRNESAHLQAIANDFAGIDENGHTLPSYNEVAAHAHRAREGSEKS